MKLHLITVGQPKLPYAKQGWEEYVKRLGRFHQVRTTHLADKYAADSGEMLRVTGKAYLVALEVTGRSLSTPELAQFLEQRAQEGREAAFIIGGPDGLPAEVLVAAQLQWSLSYLTFPHDLAMVILVEALYRASTITAGHPYHRA